MQFIAIPVVHTYVVMKLCLGAVFVLVPTWLIAAVCWQLDYGVVVLVAFSVLGGFGIGLLPLCVELGKWVRRRTIHSEHARTLRGLLDELWAIVFSERRLV